MTQEKVKDKIDAIVAEILKDVSGVAALRYYTDQILAIPEILIRDPDQSLPKLKSLTGEASIEEKVAFLQGVKDSQEQMLKPDEKGSKFVKVLPGEKE